MTTPTQRAEQALDQYSENASLLEDDVTDLLTDLRHLCAEKHINWHSAERRSHLHFCEEREEAATKDQKVGISDV